MSVELAFTDNGPAEQGGTAQVVVLLHAFPLDHRMWSAQVSSLSRRHRVIAVDLRGFGGSPLGDEPPHLDAMADDVAALLDRLGLDHVVLGGLSLGGYVAMAFLRRHARMVDAVMLIDTKASADGEQAANNRERIASTVEDDGTVDVLLTDVVPALTGPTTKQSRPEVVEAVAELAAQAPPASVAWVQRAMAARPDSGATLEDFERPSLVVVGDEDALAPPDEAQIMFDALVDPTLALLPGCGHLSAMERPGDLAEIMLDFLDDLRSAE